VLDGFSEVDAAVERVVCHPLEDFGVEAGEGVVEDQLLVEGDGREELLLQFEVPGLGEHRLLLDLYKMVIAQ
jgi:hypothetical protein